MGKKQGARSKTTTQNIQKQAPETGAKSKNVQSKNMNYDGFRNPTKSSSVEKRDSWDIPENTKRPSKYTSDEIWGSLPSNSSECENAWGKGDSNKNKGAHTNRGNRTVPLVGASFSWEDNEDFPALQNNVPIVENVWVKRKEKLEGRKAMQPSNQTEEEFMIQKAIELSKMDALESEDKKKKLEQEYEIQMALLQADPQSFAEFHTVDELAAIRNSLGSDDLIDIPNEYTDENVFDDDQEYVEDGWSSIKSKKTNFENVGKETYNEKDLSQSSNCKKNKESNKKSEFQFPEHEENQEFTDENKFESIKSKKFKNKNEKTEFHLPKVDFGLSTTKRNSETIVAVKSKSQKEIDSNVTKTIDLFGGWGSKTSESINLKATKKKELSAESNVNSLRNTDIKDVKISKQKENLKLPKTFPYTENFANEKDDAYCKKENFTDRCDNFHESEYSYSSIQNTASMPHTDSWGNVNNSDEILNRYVQSSISVSDSTPSHTMVENSSEMNEKRFHGLSDKNLFGDQKLNNTSKNDDFLFNSIVKDYANLAVKCADNFAKEKVPIQEETKDTCINLTTALKNIKQTECDLGQLNPSDPFHNINQNALLNKTLTNETCKSEITYSLNNSQVNLPATTSSESSKFFNNPETFSPFIENSMNNKFSLPLLNDTAKAASSSQEIHSVDGNIPAPVQPQFSFPNQPMPMMSNAMNPEVMINMNPLIMQQQMMVLHNPFFFQQLQQMNMYYSTMGGMPFMTGLVPPVPMVPVSPVFNNPVFNLPNNELMRNANQVDQLQTDEDLFIPPPYQKLQEKEELNDVPSLLSKSTSEHSKTPSFKFENAWLTDILSEGATVIDPDSFIPPPVPATNLSSVVYSQSTTTSAPTFNCDTRNIKVAKADYKNQNVNNSLASNENPNYVESNETGWGNIEAPSQNYSSWNNTTDGWRN